MFRKTALVVLAALLAAAVAPAGSPFRRRSAGDGMFPRTGDVPDLRLAGRVVSYKLENFQNLYGSAGNRYLQYGMLNMLIGEYTYGGKGRRVTIEVANMENPTAAAGIFHYHRGNLLAGRGRTMEVGTEGVLDTGREGRTLYFYRGSVFAKIIYGGEEPVPDLLPVALALDGKLPGGDEGRPEGLAYVEIEGVDAASVAVTPGFCFNYAFLPPAVVASAPGGGSPASDMFVITARNDKDAAQLYRDYASFLGLHAEYHEEYRRDKQRYTKAVDPNQGRVLFTAYRNALIIAARPDGYERGEPLIDRVMAKMDEINPPRRRR